MNKLIKKYPWITDDVKHVIEELKKQSHTKEDAFNESTTDLFEAKAKMLRPLLLISSARMFGGSDEIYQMGAAIEMLHDASLVHDDIIDDSPIRRGIESVQSKYGKGYAVIMGDYLFSKALLIISKSKSVADIQTTLEAVVDMTTGEVTQYFEKFRNDYSIENYYRIIDGKTASLFGLSLFLGASIAGASKKEMEIMAEVGRLFGRAFQIFDDVKDFELSEVDFGKPVLNDIKNGIYTLPIILALNKDEELKSKIQEKASDAYHDELLELTVNTNSINDAKAIANNFIDDAISKLNSLKNSEEKAFILDVLKSVTI